MNSNEQPSTNREPRRTALLQRRGRTLLLLGALLFAISTAFPVIGGVIPSETLPAWIGIADVMLAFVLVVVAFSTEVLVKGKIADEVVHDSYRLYRSMAILPLLLLVLFFLVGDALMWNVLLPGLAWRYWLLLYSLPKALTLWPMHSVEAEER